MKKWTELVTEAKMNQTDYKFYLLNKEGTKIRSGWEYQEDAKDAKSDDPKSGKIVAKSTLKSMDIDVEDDKFWND